MMGQGVFCTNCGAPISPAAVACMKCGAQPVGHRKFCRGCGSPLNPEQIVCIRCGTGVNSIKGNSRPGSPASGSPKSRTTAGILGILLGAFGVHKFYLGSWGWGLVYIGAGLITCGTLTIAAEILGIVEGIMYLMMSEEDFAAKYSSETASPFRW